MKSGHYKDGITIYAEAVMRVEMSPDDPNSPPYGIGDATKNAYPLEEYVTLCGTEAAIVSDSSCDPAASPYTRYDAYFVQGRAFFHLKADFYQYAPEEALSILKDILDAYE